MAIITCHIAFEYTGNDLDYLILDKMTIDTVGRKYFKSELCSYQISVFGRFALCYGVRNVGVWWPNRWMDQDATWYGGRPRPRRHCVTWGPSFTPRKGAKQPPTFRSMSISAHVYCGQTVAHLSNCWVLAAVCFVSMIILLHRSYHLFSSVNRWGTPSPSERPFSTWTWVSTFTCSFLSKTFHLK